VWNRVLLRNAEVCQAVCAFLLLITLMTRIVYSDVHRIKKHSKMIYPLHPCDPRFTSCQLACQAEAREGGCLFVF
jgi:hypothetical protein